MTLWPAFKTAFASESPRPEEQPVMSQTREDMVIDIRVSIDRSGFRSDDNMPGNRTDRKTSSCGSF